MKQKHDINPLAIIVVALVISFVISVMLLGGAFSKTLDYMQTEAYFEKYKEELTAIKDYVLTVDEFNVSRRGVVPECDVSLDISYLLHRVNVKVLLKMGILLSSICGLKIWMSAAELLTVKAEKWTQTV